MGNKYPKCDKCGGLFKFLKSSFEQYDPSTFQCEKCGSIITKQEMTVVMRFLKSSVAETVKKYEKKIKSLEADLVLSGGAEVLVRLEKSEARVKELEDRIRRAREALNNVCHVLTYEEIIKDTNDILDGKEVKR